MKKVVAFLSLFCSLIFSGCSKFDLASWLHKPGKQHCSVQQFNSGFVDTSIVPYLFRKTFDAGGVPQSIDAYLLAIFPTMPRFNAVIRYHGMHMYFLDAVTRDTLMDVTLNRQGRPVIAQEMPDFYQGQRAPFEPMRHEFFYLGKRLASMTTIRPFLTSNYNFTYDAAGNILSSGMGDKYAYDHTRKADHQFYMETSGFGPYLPGFRILQYMEAFPEINSPPHIRTSSFDPVLGKFDLLNHQFDSRKKLVSYKGTNEPGEPGAMRNFFLSWKCR